jgi:hypothetical protein
VTGTTPAAQRAGETKGRRIGFVLITVLFAFLTLEAWGEVIQVAVGRDRQPLALSLFQLFGGACAYATAIGTFRRRPWAWQTALAWGLVTAAMLLSLGSIPDLPAEESRGIRMGALAVLMMGAGFALYLKSVIKPR